jgi:hypothetical protein
MRLKSMLPLAFCLILAGLVATGCGGANASTSKQSKALEAVLTGLEKAAQSGTTYHAIQHAKRLPVADQAVVNAFCTLAWQISVNHEAEKLSDQEYVVARIGNWAHYEVEHKYWDGIPDAIDALEEVIDLSSLTGEQLSRYNRPCHH